MTAWLFKMLMAATEIMYLFTNCNLPYKGQIPWDPNATKHMKRLHSGAKIH